MNINEQKLLLEIKIELQKGNTFAARRNLRDLLSIAEKQSFDGFKLLFQALKDQYTTKEAKAGDYICPSCNVGFSSESALKGHGPKRCKLKKNV